MKLSARNQIAGTIKEVKPGTTTTHVTIEVSPTVLSLPRSPMNPPRNSGSSPACTQPR